MNDNKTTSLEPEPLRPIAVAIVFICGLAAGFFLLLFPFVLDERSQEYLEQDATWIWLTFTAFQIGVWALLVRPLLSIVRQLSPHFRWNKRRILSSAVLYSLLIALPILSPFVFRSSWPLQLYVAKVTIVTLFGSALGVLGFVSILLVDEGARQELHGAPSTFLINRYLVLRAHLVRLGQFLGVGIGLAMFGAGAQRGAFIAAGLTTYPSLVVFAYGAYFTVLLALAYVPTYLRLTWAARRFLDRITKLNEISPDALAKHQAARSAVEELLHIRMGLSESLRSGYAILAPLAGSLSSILLGLGDPTSG